MRIIETYPRFRSTPRRRSATRRIIIHHTYSHDVSVATIHQWHLDRGWLGVGYHYNLRSNGNIERGRPENSIGAHAKPANGDSIGIALTGRFIGDNRPTRAQMGSLVWLIRDIRSRYGALRIIGHSDVANTNCPGPGFSFAELDRMLEGGDSVTVEPENLEEHWAKDAIKWAMDREMMIGYEDGTFRPDRPVTRAEMAVILRRLQYGGD